MILSRLLGRPAQPASRVPVVYTMGKVASSAVSAAIRAEGLLAHDIHTLDRAWLMRTARESLQAGRLPPRHVCEAMAYRNTLFSEPERCLVITLVRDPLERNLSAFFETLHRQPPALREEADPAALFRLFLDSYPMDLPLTWFDREPKAQLGLDVYELPFDPARRHAEGRGLIVLRTDCPDAEKSRVLSRALGHPVRVGRGNDSAAKGYRARYEAVRAQARFPAALVERVYGSRFARHFWSEAERCAFARRWLGGAA